MPLARLRTLPRTHRPRARNLGPHRPTPYQRRHRPTPLTQRENGAESRLEYFRQVAGGGSRAGHSAGERGGVGKVIWLSPPGGRRATPVPTASAPTSLWQELKAKIDLAQARPTQAESFDVLTEELEARPGLSGTLNRALRAKTNEPPQPGRLVFLFCFSRSAANPAAGVNRTRTAALSTRRPRCGNRPAPKSQAGRSRGIPARVATCRPSKNTAS